MDPPEFYFVHHLYNLGYLTETQLNKLLESGINTITKLMALTPEHVMNHLLLSPLEYQVLSSKIFVLYRPESCSLAALVSGSTSKILSTGIKKLDALIGGGIKKGEVIEIFGSSGVGKTQFCLSVAASICKAPGVLVLYMDLKNDFLPLRFFELVKRSSEALNRVFLVREGKFKDMIDILENFEDKLRSANTLLAEELQIVIIDSLPVAFYPCMDTPAATKLHVERFTRILARLSAMYKIAFLLVNHAVSGLWNNRPRASIRQPTVNTEVPALGKYWNNVPHKRVHLQRNDNQRVPFRATLDKCFTANTNSTFTYRIVNSGIV